MTDLDFYASSVTGTAGAYKVRNSNVYSTYRGLADDTNQWLVIDLGHNISVRGVLIITNQDYMTSGKFNMYHYRDNFAFDPTAEGADAYKLETENNVGENAQGGAFNSQVIYAQYFMIHCEEKCEPELSIAIVRLWAKYILSTDATF